MEPARNGRDDREGHRPAVAGPGAAMEPARNGRDDRAPFRGALASASRPQWSPPVMGGMTRAAPSRRYVRVAAAMEPARNGRDDGRGQDHRRPLNGRAAMEPARNGRDDRRYGPGYARAARAAMEPARNGRDDALAVPLGQQPGLSRNGARP